MSDKTGKLVCTGRGSHKAKTIGHYTLLDGEPGFLFAMEVRTRAPQERGVFDMPWVTADDPPVRLRCPTETCPHRAIEVEVLDLNRFLRAEIGKRNRDVSALWASL